MNKNSILLTLIFLLAVSFGVPAMSTASTIYELNLGAVLPGGATPAGTAPWLTARFEDLATDKVRLTLISHLTQPNFLKGGSNDNSAQGWVFNFNGDPAGLTFTKVSSTNGSWAEQPFKKKDDLKISPANGFDIGFNWTDTRFVAGAVETWDITGTNIHAIDFMKKNTQGYYYSVAHVQGIVGKSGDSGKIYASTYSIVPVPGAVWLLGSGLLGLLGARRKYVG